jgi:hypothetical protein
LRSESVCEFKKKNIFVIRITGVEVISLVNVGHWSAWLVDEEGVKRTWGIIPSKYKVEEELLLKRPLGELPS